MRISVRIDLELANLIKCMPRLFVNRSVCVSLVVLEYQTHIPYLYFRVPFSFHNVTHVTADIPFNLNKLSKMTEFAGNGGKQNDTVVE